MSRSRLPVAILGLPAVAGRSALRSGLMAMRVLPRDMPADRAEADRVLRRIGDHPDTVAFIDISREGSGATPTLLELDATLPRDTCRKRVLLTRLVGGHVSEADRRWVRSLGFADLLPEFDAKDCDGSLRMTLHAVAHAISLEPPAPDELARYVRVLNEEHDRATPRSTIRALTSLSAEDLAARLHRSLAIHDRAYHLQTYPQCFTGTEAVAWMAKHFNRSADSAVALGQALGALGLLVHVAHEHPFLDERLFYRLAVSESVDEIDLSAALHVLVGQGGVRAADRSYLGKTYANCWIGSEAVDRVKATYRVARHEAWMVLHRLMQFGLVEHVTRSRPFVDGNFYYRFIGLPADGRG